MRVSDKDLHEYLENGELVIVGPRQDLPFDQYKQVQPCSIDLRLDSHFYQYRRNITQFDVRDLRNVWDYVERFEVENGQPIVVDPNSILFGQIYEQIRIPSDASGKIVGRSRFARLGLSIHATGDFINPEFEGAMPLQIINHNRFPIVIYPFMTICQLILVKLTSGPLIPYPMKSSNPYHRERVAGPSVCQTDDVLSDSNEGPTIHKEIEKRLVSKYLKEKERSEVLKGLSVNFNRSNRMSTDKSGGTIIISGSSIGVFNPGQIIGDARATINSLSGSQDSANLKSALEALLEHIETNQGQMSEQTRKEALEYTSDLSKQATLAVEQRSSASSIRMMLRGLGETVQSTAAGSALWNTWGPALSTYFGVT